MSQLKILYAKREVETSGLYAGYKKTVLMDGKGGIVSIYPAGQKQPSKLKRTITHNCFKYLLVWI